MNKKELTIGDIAEEGQTVYLNYTELKRTIKKSEPAYDLDLGIVVYDTD